MGRKGRPAKPYQTSWGEIVPGLSKSPTSNEWFYYFDGTGKKFRADDERFAVARFRAAMPSESTIGEDCDNTLTRAHDVIMVEQA